MESSIFDPPHKDLKKHAASGFVFSGLAQASKLLTQFISVVVMARLLEPSDFGLVAMVSPVYAFAVLFHDLGLSQATMQRPQLTSSQVNSFFWINVGVGMIVCSTLIAFSPVVGWFYGDPRTVALTIAMALLVFIGGLGNQHGAIMTRRMQFRAQAISGIISAIVGLAAAIGWGYFWGGYWALYVGMAVTTVLQMIGVWVCVKWRPGWPALADETFEMLKYGLGITSANLTTFVVQSANSVVVGRVLGERPLGLYDRASRLLSLPLQQMIYPISGVVVPILYRLHDDDARYRGTFLRTIGSITLAISPGVIWAIVLADLLVPTLLGAKWQETTPLFAALSLAALPQLINGSANWLFVTQGRSGDLMRWSFFSGVVSMAALLIGIFFGIVGVAVASVVSQFLRTPFLWWYACRTGPVRLSSVMYTLMPQAAGCVAACVALEALRHVWSVSAGALWPLLIVGGHCLMP